MADSGHPPAELHERLLICRTIKLNAGAHGGHRRCCHAQIQKNAQNKPQIARLILCVHTTLQFYCNLFLTFCNFFCLFCRKIRKRGCLSSRAGNLAQFLPARGMGIRKAAKLLTVAQVPAGTNVLDRFPPQPVRGGKHLAHSGNQRSAASGGNSELGSRKRHDWHACKGAPIVVP